MFFFSFLYGWSMMLCVFFFESTCMLYIILHNRHVDMGNYPERVVYFNMIQNKFGFDVEKSGKFKINPVLCFV